MKQKVLIFKENNENLNDLKEILETDYEVNLKTDYKQLKDLPGIILISLIKYQDKGFEICKRIKQDVALQNIPIIFVIDKESNMNLDYGFELGAVDYIEKPSDKSIILSRIRNYIKLSTQENEFLEKTKEITDTRLEIIRKLGLVAAFKDNETKNRVLRISYYCYEIGKNLNLTEDELELLLNIAPMYDIGKIGIPDEIIKKPGKLDKQEWETIKKHTDIGYELLKNDKLKLLNTASIVAYEHHEKWNGKGYPRGLQEKEINLYARIVSVADVFDGLTSERPYKKVWDPERAIMLIINEKESSFDPDVVDAFNKGLDKILDIQQKYKDIH